MPYRVGFETVAEGFYAVFETIVDIYFIVDILVTLNSGIYHKGAMVMNRKNSTLIYLKTWFFLDVIASFPYEFVFD